MRLSTRIIADDAADAGRRARSAPALGLGSAALVLGGMAAIFYHRAGLTLSHYDAKAHLVVARRILDSLTPGWDQIGAIWLPLPHLLNMLPVQIDLFYRTGASAVAISILSYALGVAAAALVVVRATGSTVGAATAAGLLALNPSILYLEATPLTETLLLGTSLLALAATYRWVQNGAEGSARMGGLPLAAACLTRYEAWPIAGALSLFVCLSLWRGGQPASRALRSTARLAAYPAGAVGAFLVFSRIVVGRWLVTEGFFVIENPAAGSVWLTTLQVMGGLQLLAGRWVASLTVTALAAIPIVALSDRARAPLLLPLSLFAAAALPSFAYFQGHPFRVRYAVALVAAAAVTLGITVGLLRRWRAPVAILMVGPALLGSPPLSTRAPMVLEAQWDAADAQARRAITKRLAAGYRGERILVSMASLAHYMQETSEAGLPLREFIHEGNAGYWRAALADPARHAGWILIREGDREGRDVIGVTVKERPAFLDGFRLEIAAGTVALYRRVTDPSGPL